MSSIDLLCKFNDISWEQEKYLFSAKSACLKNLIEKLETPINKVAIELNEEIIDKKKLNKVFLKNKDKIEIVHFIGGG